MSGVTTQPGGALRIALLLLSLLLGCANREPPNGVPGCPVMPVPSQSLGDAANLRAQVEIRSHQQKVGFDVIARSSGDELIVIGLSPHGTRLFTVHQRGQEFEVEPTSSSMLRHVALWIMDALHRSHWIESPSASPSDEVLDSDRAGEILRESTLGAGRRREFLRPPPAPAVAGVTIHYAPPSAQGGTGLIEIRNEWCGYDASIVILDERVTATKEAG
jgi:hypothetical protein